MRKLLFFMMIFMMMLSLLFGNIAFSENMGVIIINSSEEKDTAYADDMLLNVPTEIDSFGIVTPTDFQIADQFGWYRQGYQTVYDAQNDYDFSGNDAEYAILWFDILNTCYQERHYLANYDSDISATVILDDQYSFSGWVGQLNYDYSTSDYGPDAGKQNVRWVINGKDQFAIIPMSVGHYMCVCEIPNLAVKGDAPMRMVIQIGDVELIYNIRK